MKGTELSFDEDCLIFVADDELRVISRLSTVTLKSRNLGRLHRELSKYICGQYDQESILAGVSTLKRPAVELYLGALTNAGAIRTVTTDQIRPGPGRVHCSWDGKRPAPAGSDRRLIFASTDWVRRRLLRVKYSSKGPSSIYVAVASGTNIPELPDHRELLSRWFISSGGELFKPARTAVYRLQKEPLRLTREVVIDGPELASALPQQLSLVRPADVSQLPLVCLTASHWLFPRSLSRFGLEHEQVEKQLTREFLAAALQDDGALPRRTRVFRSGTCLETEQCRPASGEWLSTQVVADSLRDLRAASLDVEAARLPVGQAAEVDLLDQGTDHPQIRYLLTVLRSRVGTLPGISMRLSEGSFCYQAGKHRCCSFIRVKALRDLLQQVVGEIFYGAADPGIAVSPAIDFDYFTDSIKLNRLLKLSERQREVGTHLFYRKVRCWGTTLYLGGYSACMVCRGV